MQQNVVNVKLISAIVKQWLQDQYIQKWSSESNDSSKGQIIKIFKNNFSCKGNINILVLSHKLRKIFMKLIETHVPFHGLSELTELKYYLCSNNSL